MSFQIKPATRIGKRGALVPLTKGLFAFVDESDLLLVKGMNWYAMRSKNTFYAASNAPMKNGIRGKTILMHKIICNSELVDHKDRNGLNNRRDNLRPANRSLNAVNSKIKVGKTSQYRGVLWDVSRKKWAAYMRIGGKVKNLGRFKTEQEAAEAYQKAASPTYGEFLRN